MSGNTWVPIGLVGILKAEIGSLESRSSSPLLDSRGQTGHRCAGDQQRATSTSPSGKDIGQTGGPGTFEQAPDLLICTYSRGIRFTIRLSQIIEIPPSGSSLSFLHLSCLRGRLWDWRV